MTALFQKESLTSVDNCLLFHCFLHTVVDSLQFLIVCQSLREQRMKKGTVVNIINLTSSFMAPANALRLSRVLSIAARPALISESVSWTFFKPAADSLSSSWSFAFPFPTIVELVNPLAVGCLFLGT